MAEQGTDYTERGGEVTGTSCLVVQLEKMINFISKKTSDHTELSQTTFAIPSKPGKQAGALAYNCNREWPVHPVK